ncbi:hypothetical protein [Secundilactobacillus silagei]|uniref:hypothetical protein n=1 Tax=Secundilactobacillus silagei TaxID=1293415 RepID=UPI002092C4FF|nr:hypothetical protein [Secundilactobacillus silagei]
MTFRWLDNKNYEIMGSELKSLAEFEKVGILEGILQKAIGIMIRLPNNYSKMNWAYKLPCYIRLLTVLFQTRKSGWND